MQVIAVQRVTCGSTAPTWAPGPARKKVERAQRREGTGEKGYRKSGTCERAQREEICHGNGPEEAGAPPLRLWVAATKAGQGGRGRGPRGGCDPCRGRGFYGGFPGGGAPSPLNPRLMAAIPLGLGERTGDAGSPRRGRPGGIGWRGLGKMFIWPVGTRCRLSARAGFPLCPHHWH